MVVRIASYNTALSRPHAGELLAAIRSAKDPQVLANVALLHRIRPDIVLLNEVDFDASGELVKALLAALNQPSSGGAGLDYGFYFCRPVNTGMPSGRDFDKDGVASDKGADALGFGDFPGQYGMLLLSRFPIDQLSSRTFQQFLWRDMPNGSLPKQASGDAWFDADDLAVLPLSSKSHWDVAVQVNGGLLRCLCSHPTPPAFDGPEQRNLYRNQAEIRFWSDYLTAEDYVIDDQGRRGGVDASPFVLLGDLNASPYEGDASRSAIRHLLQHPKMSPIDFPRSVGAIEHSPNVNTLYSAYHTALWRMQADYVRPSRDLAVLQQAVFWPHRDDPHVALLHNTSDHRLVWLDLDL